MSPKTSNASGFNFFNTGSVLIIILPIVSTAVVPAASKKISGFFHDHMNKNRDFSEHLWPYLMLKNWILNRK